MLTQAAWSFSVSPSHGSLPWVSGVIPPTRVLYNLGAFLGHSANCRTTAATDQKDGAPRQGEHKAEGDDENDGEKRLEGPARKGSCQIKRARPGKPKGRLIRAADGHLRAVEAHLRAAEKRLQAKERYDGSANLFCIAK